jgi:hypothetical protein
VVGGVGGGGGGVYGNIGDDSGFSSGHVLVVSWQMLS